jgi:DNA-binding NarL/FixJ family response regulator
MKTVRLMFVDDQKIFIESLTEILKKVDKSLKVVSCAYDGAQAVEAVEKSLPEVIVMDIRMPVMNGVEAVRIIHERHPGIKIIMLTTYDDDEYVTEALRYGASGYLLKDIPIDDLVAQIKSVCSADVAPLSRSVLSKLTRTIGETPQAGPPQAQPPSWLEELNRAERKILKLMGEGLDNKEIAVRAFLAEQTVRNYIHMIYEKVGVKSRAHAIREARRYNDLL